MPQYRVTPKINSDPTILNSESVRIYNKTGYPTSFVMNRRYITSITIQEQNTLDEYTYTNLLLHSSTYSNSSKNMNFIYISMSPHTYDNIYGPDTESGPVPLYVNALNNAISVGDYLYDVLSIENSNSLEELNSLILTKQNIYKVKAVNFDYLDITYNNNENSIILDLAISLLNVGNDKLIKFNLNRNSSNEIVTTENGYLKYGIPTLYSYYKIWVKTPKIIAVNTGTTNSILTYTHSLDGIKSTLTINANSTTSSSYCEKIYSFSATNPENIIALNFPYYEGDQLDFSSFVNLNKLGLLSGKITSTTLFPTTAAKHLPSGLKELNIETLDINKVTTLENAFYASSLTTIYANDLDTSNVTSLKGAFKNCYSLKNIFLKRWDTSNVTSLYELFHSCLSLTDVSSIAKWDVSNVTTMSGMFYRVPINSITLSSWKPLNLEQIGYLFGNCTLLTTINMPFVDLNKLKGIARAFYNCSKLLSVNLTSWYTTNVSSMEGIFYNCSSLSRLTFGSNWDMINVINVSNMFTGCTSLKTIRGTISNIKVNLDMSDCPLNYGAANIVVKGLYTYTDSGSHVLYLNSTNISDTNKTTINATATSKGWTIAWT